MKKITIDTQLTFLDTGDRLTEKIVDEALFTIEHDYNDKSPYRLHLAISPAKRTLTELLLGDGRRIINPYNVENIILIGNPMSMTVGRTRELIHMFNSLGHSNHSSSASTLWVLMTYVIEQKIRFKLQGELGYGFHLEKI